LAALIIGIVALGVIISGLTAFAQVAINEFGDSSQAVRLAAQSIGNSARTRLASLPACEQALGSSISFGVENTGTEPLHSFAEWDMIGFYNTSAGEQVSRLSYTPSTTPAAGEWTVTQIEAASGSEEVIGRGVVNSGERIQITAVFASDVWASSGNKLKLSTPTGASLEIDISGSNPCAFYLHNGASTPTADTASSIDLPATAFYPGQSTLYNYDTDRDAQSGIVIGMGASGPTESSSTLYQNWQTAALDEDLELQGTVNLRLFAAVENFSTSSTGSLIAYLRDWDGASYTEIANTTLTEGPWDSGATGTFLDKTLSFDNVDYTIGQGNQLEVKVIVGASSSAPMWLAYDTLSYPARLSFPLVLDLYHHSENQKIATSTYYELNVTAHEGSYYLHNNPTPPVDDTDAQTNLTMSRAYPSTTTLFNYDRDLNAEVGRSILVGGTLPGESAITLAQNWRAGPFSSDLEINGTVQIGLWTAVTGFSTTDPGRLTVFLRDYDGESFTEIGSAVVSATPWDTDSSGTWVKKLFEVDVDNHTVDQGNRLELKVVSGSGATSTMLLAYDTPQQPSEMRLPGDFMPKQKGNPTISAAFNGSTGRVDISQNEGRFIYRLSDYNAVSQSEWDFTYRARHNEGSSTDVGWTWLTDAIDITPSTTSAWTDIDLSALVPSDASGVVVQLLNENLLFAYKAAVRGKEDTRDYVALYTETLAAGQHRWQIVKLDSNRVMQGYSEDSTSGIAMKLMGYTAGPEPGYFSSPPDITPATTTAWTTVDVSAHVDEKADGVILLVDNGGAADDYAIREVGSTFSDTTKEISADGNTMYLVGIDSNDKFEVYLGSTDINVFLIGQTRGSVIYNTDNTSTDNPSGGSWGTLDADDFGVPTLANGLILYVSHPNAVAREIGLRSGGSTDDFSREIWSRGALQAGVGLNAANGWDEYLDIPVQINAEITIAAYTRTLPPDLVDTYVGVDVRVRNCAGDVTATLGTEVATTSVNSLEWTSVTSTFTPPAYSFNGDDCYMEFQLFGYATRNDGPEGALEVRIDDKTVDLTDWTHIDNIAFWRD
jgi:hypothetical protein